jgi:DNA-binding XRE family transcriptional regulator
VVKLAVFHNPRATLVDRMVGRKIKERRLEQGLAKQQVARHIGCSNAAYDALEDGYLRPDVTTVHALAVLLKCRMSDFFTDIK